MPQSPSHTMPDPAPVTSEEMLEQLKDLIRNEPAAALSRALPPAPVNLDPNDPEASPWGKVILLWHVLLLHRQSCDTCGAAVETPGHERWVGKSFSGHTHYYSRADLIARYRQYWPQWTEEEAAREIPVLPRRILIKTGTVQHCKHCFTKIADKEGKYDFPAWVPKLLPAAPTYSLFSQNVPATAKESSQQQKLKGKASRRANPDRKAKGGKKNPSPNSPRVLAGLPKLEDLL